jgi:thiol-disulfide isomerase/thioredoxin
MNRILCSLALLAMATATHSVAADEPPSLFDQLKTAIAEAVDGARQWVPLEQELESADHTAVTWHATLEVAIDDARQSGKPIFVIVGAPWCAFCEKLTGNRTRSALRRRTRGFGRAGDPPR